MFKTATLPEDVREMGENKIRGIKSKFAFELANKIKALPADKAVILTIPEFLPAFKGFDKKNLQYLKNLLRKFGIKPVSAIKDNVYWFWSRGTIESQDLKSIQKTKKNK